MILSHEVLRASGIHYYQHPKSTLIIKLSGADQILGTYSEMKQFRDANPDYSGWHAHHIVEKVDLERLGIKKKFPDGEDQLTVLLPERARGKD